MNVELDKFSKILVIRLSSLGDIILTTPIIRAIKENYPKLRIDFMLRKEYGDILKFNPNINELILLNKDYKLDQIRDLIKNNGYNLIIDLQNNLRSRLLSFNITEIRRFKKPHIKKLLLVKLKLNTFNKVISIPERYAMSIPGLELDKGGLELHLPDNIETNLSDKFEYVGFCPGSRHLTKMWPQENFIKLGQLLSVHGYKIVLFGGRDDIKVCKAISEELEGSINLSNDNKLLELAAGMKRCKFVLCNDSGLMHTASAVNIPVAAIFGSTVREFGFFPYKGKNLVLENKSLSCRPCTHIGREKCPKSHMDCLKKLTPEFVFSELNRFLKTI